MRVFVTGSTGFVGTATVRELLRAGHQVVGLARSDASVAALHAAGAVVHRGDLEDLASLQAGARGADAVIHLGFIHDFANFAKSCEIDKKAIEALGEALAGTQKPLIVASGLAFLAVGSVATEETLRSTPSVRVSEETALALAAKGINATAVRLPPSVHGDHDIGFIPLLIGLARRKGESAYVGSGANRWPAAHVNDAATLFRLVLERGRKGAIYHAVADEGVAFKDIAAVIGARLQVPVVSKSVEEAPQHFSWFAALAGMDQPASSATTQTVLGWKPKEAGLLQDVSESKLYFEPNPRALSA